MRSGEELSGTALTPGSTNPHVLVTAVGCASADLEHRERAAILCGSAAVAQLDRVLGYEPRGRGFESCQPRQVNQRVSFERGWPVCLSGGRVRDSGAPARLKAS